jgi:membrane protein YqaA with SNARE-associated domain
VKRFLATFAYSFVAGVFPLLNVEAYLLAFSSYLSIDAMVPVVLAATAGQMLAKSLLYLSGMGLLRLPHRATRERLERITERLRTYRRGTWTLVLISAFFGLPPLYIVSIAAGTLRLHFGVFLAISTAGRLLRLSVVALLPQLVRYAM